MSDNSENLKWSWVEPWGASDCLESEAYADGYSMDITWCADGSSEVRLHTEDDFEPYQIHAPCIEALMREAESLAMRVIDPSAPF